MICCNGDGSRVSLETPGDLLNIGLTNVVYAALGRSVNNILFKYKVHQDTTDTSYIKYNTFERDTKFMISIALFSNLAVTFLLLLLLKSRTFEHTIAKQMGCKIYTP